MCMSMEERKKLFVDGITDHFDNFIKRMEKEGKRDYSSRNKRKEIGLWISKLQFDNFISIIQSS